MSECNIYACSLFNGGHASNCDTYKDVTDCLVFRETESITAENKELKEKLALLSLALKNVIVKYMFGCDDIKCTFPKIECGDDDCIAFLVDDVKEKTQCTKENSAE